MRLAQHSNRWNHYLRALMLLSAAITDICCTPVPTVLRRQQITGSGYETDDGWSLTSKADILMPVLVDENSYSMQHVAAEWWQPSNEISMTEVHRENEHSIASAQVYHLTAFAKTFKLFLQPKLQKATETLIFESQANDTLSQPSISYAECESYSGFVNQEVNSLAMIDICQGLSGFILTEKDQFIIEPISEAMRSTMASNGSDVGNNLHFIYTMPVLSAELHMSKLPAHELWETSLNTTNGGITIARDAVGKAERSSRPAAAADNRARRRRRSVSKERHVETLVVVDKTMVKYHGKENVHRYVIALMKSVLSIYQDESLGNFVNIHLTKIVVLTEDQENLTIVHHADKTLDSFCSWQSQLRKNPPGDSIVSVDHDVAILLTRVDICSHADEPCGTIGLAPVSGMCQPDRACSIIEDIGLGTAFIIAHEMGHMFGIPHDGVGNECGSNGHDAARIMAMHMTLSKDLFTWSNCSRSYITTFLDSGRGFCLDNKPDVMEWASRKQLPGEIYNADEQCKYQFHAESVVCKERDICRELWCTTTEGFCLTNGFPASDGTKCRTRRVKYGWCIQGRCMEHGRQPQSLDGSWGSWSSWGPCSRTCGGGVASSHRDCDNPKPQNGGRYCLGERSRYSSCSTEGCPANSTELRAIQCTQTNSAPFRGEYYQWLPFHAPNVNPCSLYCIAFGYNFYTERSSKVIDGTQCYADMPYGTCINGECVKIGCDRVIGSAAVEDECRVCQGNGTSCQTQSGLYSAHYKDNGYYDVIHLPRGALSIKITEVSQANNYLALRNKAGTYYLNGQFTIDWPRKIHAAGTVFTYLRNDNQPEELTALGPIDEELTVMVLFQGYNPGIEWQYSTQMGNLSSSGGLIVPSDPAVRYQWRMGNWSDCTASCAGGQQVAQPECIRLNDDSVVVGSDKCSAHGKPEARHQICNLQPCPAGWTVGRWSECSQDCGSGKRYRQVVCMQKTNQATSEIVDDTVCVDARPLSEEPCKEASCPTVWRLGNWTLCSVTCGRGWQSREVACFAVPSGKATLTPVQPVPTPVPDGHCRHTQKPAMRQACSGLKPDCPPAAMWVSGEWSKCTTSCGHGVQSRVVMCTTSDGKVSYQCEQSNRPATVRDCSPSPAECRPAGQSGTGSHLVACDDDPKVTYCPLVRELSFCNRSFFRDLCCRTCAS